MRVYIIIILLSLLPLHQYGQQGRSKEDSIRFYLEKADAHLYENLAIAIPLLQKAERLAGSSSSERLSGDVAHSFAVAYYIKGAYDTSLAYFLSAGEQYAKAAYPVGRAKSFIGQGLIQQGIDRHEQAEIFFRKAIEAYREAGDFAAASPAFLNIAISEIEQGNLAKAEEHLEIAQKLAAEAGRTNIEHMVLNNLGEVAFKKGHPEAAIQFYQKVLNHEVPPNGWEKSFSNAGLARAYNVLGAYERAEKLGMKSFGYAKKTNSLWDLDRNTRVLYEIYKSKGDYEKALAYHEINEKYRDSLYDQQRVRQVNMSQLKTKEADNLRLELENERAERALTWNRNLIVLLVLLAIFLSTSVLFYRRSIREKSRFNQELEQKNQTILGQNQKIREVNRQLDRLNHAKDRLFSVLSHDLRSPIGSIEQVLMLMKNDSFSEEEKVQLLDELLEQVGATSLMLNNLLHWANTQIEGVEAKPEATDLPVEVDKILKVYAMALRTKGIKIVHKTTQKPLMIMADRGQLSIIIHNLVSNAIKFTRERGQIQINYQASAENVIFRIKDEGEGISEEKLRQIRSTDARITSEVGTSREVGTGLGLLLIKQFIPLNKAQLRVTSVPGEGAVFQIRFLKALQMN